MKFILTKELGRLSKWLRILGYDAEYCKEDKPATVLVNALKDDRVVLTRSTRFPRTLAVRTVHITSDHLKEQLAQVIEDLGLKAEKERMFSRCLVCNLGLEPTTKETIRDRVPEYVYNTQGSFFACPLCLRVYWQGTHWGNVAGIIEKIDKVSRNQ